MAGGGGPSPAGPPPHQKPPKRTGKGGGGGGGGPRGRATPPRRRGAGWIARSEGIHPIPKTAASSRATAAAEADSTRFGRQLPRGPRCALTGRKAIDIRDPPPDSIWLCTLPPDLTPGLSPLPASWRAIHLSPSTGRQCHADHRADKRSQRREHRFAGIRKQVILAPTLGIHAGTHGQAGACSNRQPDERVSPAMPRPLQRDAPDVLPGECLLAGRRVDRQ